VVKARANILGLIADITAAIDLPASKDGSE